MFVSYDTFAAASTVKNPDAQGAPPSIVAVEPEPREDPRRLAVRIDAEVAGVEALDRQTAVDSLPGVASVTTSFTIILTLALVVITLVVGIFFVILTVQKTPSLTLLRAIGASGGALVHALLVQVAIIVAVGIAMGAAMLWVASLASSARFPISFDPAVVLSRRLAVAVLSVLASLAAIRRVLRIDPIAAITPMGADE